ncbi:MAG TPA: hypothetical protein VFI12_04375 [Thermomicrobiales bacterium]|jgi:hypothetical protein|nr:hypothetical protein [Thermomicrobiales bacterium]
MTRKESNDAFNPAFDKMAASAFQGSGPAFGDVEAEVEGHILDDKAYEANAFQSDGPAFGSDDAEVEGHIVDDKAYEANAFQSDGPAFGDDEAAAEVEGHLHPILMEDYSRVQAANSEAAIARAQRASEARTDRDGGVLDKVLRRKSK